MGQWTARYQFSEDVVCLTCSVTLEIDRVFTVHEGEGDGLNLGSRR
jgi:hypothetical protein